MKNAAPLLSLILPLAITCVGSPLQKEQVAADAGWLLHLDVDQLRSTTVGDYVINQLLATQMGPLTRQFNMDLDWKKVNSLTAYGTGNHSKSDFNGVLLIKTELDLRDVLDAAIEKTSQETNKGATQIQRTQEGEVTTYSMKDHLFVSFTPGKPVLVGKSLDAIQKAGEVLSGTSANLTSTKAFPEFPKAPKPYFFMGTMKAFNLAAEHSEDSQDGEAPNPKAKILKLADSGRVVLGEDSNQLFLDVSLKAKSAEVVTQMQQVIQGMIALASLSQLDNHDLQQLAQSAKVSSTGNIVSLELGYPADQAVQLLSSNLNSRMGHKEHTAKSERHGKKHRAKNSEPSEQPEKTDEQ